jgi:type I restriction enzyme S subunit
MKTPEARALCAEGSAGSAHSTLSISTLAQLPIPLPPLDVRMHLLHTMRLVEQRIAQNTRIAACAMELADAHFARFVREDADPIGRGRALADVGSVTSGMRRSDAIEDVDDGVLVDWVAPAEVLQHRLAHLDRADQTTWAPPWAVCAPGSLLVAPRPGGVETVVSRIPVVPGRGILAIRTAGEVDRMWLLHELRSRSKELVATAQGQQGREMSRKAFSRLTVSWPDAPGVREPFSRIAVPLHERAEAALGENRVLEKLITSLLTETAEKADGRG